MSAIGTAIVSMPNIDAPDPMNAEPLTEAWPVGWCSEAVKLICSYFESMPSVSDDLATYSSEWAGMNVELVEYSRMDLREVHEGVALHFITLEAEGVIVDADAFDRI